MSSYDDWKTEAPEDQAERLGTHADDDVPDEDDEPEFDGDESWNDAWEGGFCENH